MTDSKKIEDGGPDLTSLIEKLEKAEGRDRELDGDIHNTVFRTAYVFAPHSVTGFLTSATNNGCPTVAGYTSSIDAAVSLAERVLPNEPILMGMRQTEKTIPWARIGNLSPFDNTAPTLAIALVLATLRALQSRGEA
ncbi:hypothetical protein [Shinella sp.]|uniref:hypothetical protein n=1 Tax=Shinella sp. TaxID=1870904 RepID=UPI0028B115EB|nr:hypothetical protein [Shinella sp.]